jgi:hypothetical protein
MARGVDGQKIIGLTRDSRNLRIVFKYPFTILLMLVVGLQTFSKWFVILGFEINRNYISTKLCVNREMPGSCCRGKCYLNKQLSRESDQQLPANNNQKDEVHFFSEDPASWRFTTPGPAKRNTHPYTCGVSQEYFISVFQPPQV